MTSPKGRRGLAVGAWFGSVGLAVGAGWWAALSATRPPQVPTPTSSAITVAVVEGRVLVEQVYGINVTWPSRPVGVNGLAGTLTSLAVKPTGTKVKAGDTLYSVDLAPVLALPGRVPAFRDLGPGRRGADVKQLERFLDDAGFLAGSADSHYTAATATAVNRWWKRLGLKQDGLVPLGRVVFLSLPATLAPGDGVRTGAALTQGQEILVGAESASPMFSFRVLPEAVSRTKRGLQVKIDANGTTWRAEVDRLANSTQEDDTTIALLRASSGASICGGACATAVPLGGKTVLPGTLTLVPETKGAQVPTAAIRTNAGGATCVVLEGGESQPVTITAASDDGRSIVDGVRAGQRVVVAGQDVTC